MFIFQKILLIFIIFAANITYGYADEIATLPEDIAPLSDEIATLTDEMVRSSDEIAPNHKDMRTLSESIYGTLSTNRAIKILKENRTAAEESIIAAKAGWGPRVDLRSEYGGNATNNQTTRNTNTIGEIYESGSLSATLTQPIWDGFATKSRVKIAEATKNSVDYRIYDNATKLALDAIIAHIDLIRLRNIRDLSQNNVDTHQELLISSRAREAVGADTMADVSKAEGRLARALSNLADAKARLVEGEASYKRVTGLSTPSELEPVELPKDMFTTPNLVLTDAEKYNNKIKAYQEDIRSAQGSKELNESAYHPNVNLEAGPRYSDSAEGYIQEQYSQSVDIKAVMTWNIYNSGADIANTRASAAQVRQARQVLYNYMDDLILEIKTTWSGYENAKELLIHYTNALKYNKITIDAYIEQFYAGQRSILDVLDAESELYSSATQAETATGNILVNAYKLYGLAANLLTTLGVDTSSLSEDAATEEQMPVINF